MVRDIFEHEGTLWKERAKLGFKGVLDPGDSSGRKNLYMDAITRTTLQRHLARERANVVLDFGCGVGRITPWLTTLASKVYGIDVCEEMIEVAREEASHSGVDYIHFDGERIPFADGYFDLVLSVNVLMYPIREPETFARITHEIARVIRPGGRLAMIETAYPNPDGRIYRRDDYIKRFVEENLTLKMSHPTRDGGGSPFAKLAYSGLVPTSLFPLLAHGERWLLRSRNKQERRLLQGSYLEYWFEFRKGAGHNVREQHGRP